MMQQDPPHSVDRRTDTIENSTFRQPSDTDGKNFNFTFRFCRPALSVGKHEQQHMGIEKLLLQLTNLVRLGSADGNVEVTEKYYRRSIGQALVCGTFPIQVI